MKHFSAFVYVIVANSPVKIKIIIAVKIEIYQNAKKQVRVMLKKLMNHRQDLRYLSMFHLKDKLKSQY